MSTSNCNIPSVQTTGGVSGGSTTIPYVPYTPPPQPSVSWATLTTTPTLAEKAEIVLALLFARVHDEHWVELTANDDAIVCEVRDYNIGLTSIQVAPDATAADIIEFLYDAIGTPRGRALR